MLFPDEPLLNVYDGVLGLLAFNDERPVELWSHYHAYALADRITEFRERLRVAEWTVTDAANRLAAMPEGATAARRALLSESVQAAEARRDQLRRALPVLEQRARIMDAAREADWYAPRESPFTFAAVSETSAREELAA